MSDTVKDEPFFLTLAVQCYDKEIMDIPRKKVLFLITKSNLGGAQRYVYDLATALPSEQFDAVAIVGGEGELKEKLTQEGLKVYSLSSLKRNISITNDLRALFSIFNIIRKEKPDILHINSSKAGALGSLAGRLLGVPKIVFTAHGWAFNEDRPLWQKSILKAIHFFTILLSHVTIVVAEGTKKQMDWPFIQKKMTVVYLGRTITGMRYKDEARGILETKVTNTSARLIDHHADFWIGTIAELHPIKRLNRAIDAVSALIKEFPTLRFIIIHDGELREQLQQQVKNLGLEEHVFFTGIIEDAARFLPAFDLFVLPSKSEAFPYVLIEAGQANLPVVATAVGGVPDIITDGQNGLLVAPDDTPALTNALRMILRDEELRLRLARAHYDKAQTFTLEKMTADTVSVYRK